MEGALDAKTKELISVAIAVALLCEYRLWKPRAWRRNLEPAIGRSWKRPVQPYWSGGPGPAYGSTVVLEILDELKI